MGIPIVLNNRPLAKNVVSGLLAGRIVYKTVCSIPRRREQDLKGLVPTTIQSRSLTLGVVGRIEHNCEDVSAPLVREVVGAERRRSEPLNGTVLTSHCVLNMCEFARSLLCFSMGGSARIHLSLLQGANCGCSHYKETHFACGSCQRKASTPARLESLRP